MKTSKIMVIAALAGVGMVLMPRVSLGETIGVPGIVSSKHDFTSNTNYWIAGATNTWVKFNNLCGVCHTIHHAKDDRLAPLWIHDSSTTVFTPYSSPTMRISTGNPGGVSRACLSCHDGSVAINSIDGVVVGSTEVKIPSTSTAAIGAGGDLTTTHPIGLAYDPVADDGLNPISTTVFGAGGKNIDQFMLIGGKVECASCHDIHRQKGNSMNSGIYTKVGGAGSRASELCVTCHKK